MKKLHQLLYFLLFWQISFVASAQIVDTSQVNIDIAATGQYQEGNFERLQLINKADIAVNSKNRKWEFQTRHLYLYQTVFGRKNQDDYLTRNFLTYRITDKWDVFGAFFFEQLFIKRIDSYYQYGIGTRYAFIKKPRVFVQVGLMGSYSDKRYAGNTFEDFDNGGSNTIENFFITPVLDMRFVVIPKKLIVKFLGWYQQDFDETENWRYVLDTSLFVPLWKGLSLKASVNNFYENINLVGAKDNDLFITYGLNFKFKK